MIISSGLYDEILKKNATNAKRLKILSGYASAEFLERVVYQFPNLEIDLYIGMAKQGITQKDHLKFTSLCKNNSLIKVYYQIYEPNNHMKIYQFENDTETKSFIGSANFSENGFIKQKEILASINTNFQYLFDEQINISLKCTDVNILDFIALTIDDSIDKHEETLLQKNITNNGNSKFSSNVLKNKTFLRTKINPSMYEKFDLLIVQPAAQNPRWASTTINARFINRKSFIRQNNTWNFQNVFPSNVDFKIYFETNCVTSYLDGEFGAHLYFKDFDLYDYLYKKLLLLEDRAINYEELAENGYERLYFSRINETTYLMSFENNL